MDNLSTPIVCTLSPNEAGQRPQEFEELFANHLRELTRPAPDQARFVLQHAGEIEGSACDLFAREHKCCAFFDFVVQRLGGDLIVQAEVPIGAEAVLDELVAIAHRAAPRVLA